MSDADFPAPPFAALPAPARIFIERLEERSGPVGWVIPPHRHASLLQLFLILRGAARATIDGRTQALELPALLFVPALVVHGFRFAPATEGFVLTVSQELVPELAEAALLRALGLERWRLGRVPARLEDLFTRLFGALRVDGAGGAAQMLRVKGLALEVLAEAVECFGLVPAQAPLRAAERYLGTFEDWIRRDLAQPRKVEDYARALGISAAHLTRICRARLGLGPAKLIEMRRVAEARRLLAYSTMTVAEVGYRLGFDDPAHFSRVFKRAMGMSPKAFRRLAVGSDLPAG